MTAPLFNGFVAAMAIVIVTVAARYLGGRAAVGVAATLVAWLAYVGAMSYAGVVGDTAGRPPGVVFVAGPVITFLVLLVVLPAASRRVVAAVPLWVLVGTQTFRVGVELFLHRLWIEGLVPRMLTFAGANVDVYIGASAPLIAWGATRGRAGLRVALAWNGLGLLALANVVARAVLTAPGPLNRVHAEVPNQMIGTFPYTFVPGLFVPLAVVLHVLAIRAARGRLRPGDPDVALAG